MIELTEAQLRALQNPDGAPMRLVNPQTNEAFVLLSVTEYERLKNHEYDDSPWTRQELEAAAWEVGDRTGWEEYDDIAETT